MVISSANEHCGDLPLRLQQAVEALEALVPTGTKLYQARSDHTAKQQWDHPPTKAAAGPAGRTKETRNAARRRRNKKQAALAKTGEGAPAEPDVSELEPPTPAHPPDEEDGGDRQPLSDESSMGDRSLGEQPDVSELDLQPDPDEDAAAVNSKETAPPPVSTPDPIEAMPTCGNAQTILAWATTVASIAEETINQTFRSSLEATCPKTMGMAPGLSGQQRVVRRD